MLFLKSSTQNPYFNIATEEYLLKYFDDDFFFLYINEPSIVVGKHQNTIAEINVPYVIDNQLKVVRRLSGGGTVFHDDGNLNYCFIKKGKEGYLVDFKKYTQPILDTLQKLGVAAYLRGKSDLVIEDLKFSGNAEHIFKGKVLHHGTLLFSSQLNNLNEAIKNDWSRFSDKAVRSNRSKVTNISSHLSQEMEIETFVDKVFEQVRNENSEFKEYILTETDIAEINKLVEEKYKTWEWNFAYSPKYKLTQSIEKAGQTLTTDLEIIKGAIVKAQFLQNDTGSSFLTDLSELLKGQKHEYYALIDVVNEYLDKFPHPELDAKTILKTLF